jgi:CRISPR-associated protein Cas8b/Csh1 subtype I-B
MLTPIAEIGRLQPESISSMLDKITAKQVLAVQMKYEKGEMKYDGISLEEVKEPEKYLYKKDPSGKPGLFISWRIGRGDINKFKKAIKDNDTRNLNDFRDKKIDWLSRLEGSKYKSGLKIVGREVLKGNKVLDDILLCYAKNSDAIYNDLKSSINSLQESEELLITIKVMDQNRWKYPGDYNEFVSEIRNYILGGTYIRGEKNTRCIICGKKTENIVFYEKALPFIFTDQKVYYPGGKEDEKYKSLPICDDCHLDLSNGWSFVRDHLDFSIVDPAGKKTGLRFCLVPNIGNSALSLKVLEKIKSQNLYLRKLKDLVEKSEYAKLLNDMENVEETDEELVKESFLTYTSLFYYIDEKGHMRLLNSIDGIYPQRLNELAEKSWLIYKNSYRELGIGFTFSVLSDFWRGGDSREKAELAELIGDIFLGINLDPSYVYSVLVEGLRREITGPKVKIDFAKLKSLRQLSLSSMLVLEYFAMIGLLDVNSESSHMETPRISNEMIEEFRKFVNNHTAMLYNGTLVAVFGIGTAFGIALSEQQKRLKSTSLWTRLNRLQLDADRLKRLYPVAVDKLKQYKAEGYNELIAYISSSAVSRLDPNELDKMNNDLLNIVFTVGLGEGFMIAQMSPEKEVN